MNNTSYAVVMLSLILVLVATTKNNEKTKARILLWSLPESKGCIYPTKEVRHTKTEIKHILPVALIHKCIYDTKKRLIKVSTYNFERGFQMERPTQEVLYEWENFRLSKYSTRKASHGNGEVDVEVYRLIN
jgi:hypothetical protein